MVFVGVGMATVHHDSGIQIVFGEFFGGLFHILSGIVGALFAASKDQMSVRVACGFDNTGEAMVVDA